MPINIDNPDIYYELKGTCIGCRRVTWLCRRDRRCSKYATKPKKGYVANPAGYKLNQEVKCTN